MSDVLSPEEIAAIKAENSRRHRAAQTTRNLIWALVATLLVVLFLVLVVVRPDPAVVDPIDYQTVAAQAQDGTDETIAAPTLPPKWTSNSAELRADGDIQLWYVGFITPSDQFIALNQGIDANETWAQNLLDDEKATDTIRIDGVEWTVYDHRDAEDPGNLAYALVTVVGDSTYVLNGTASDTEFETLATAIGLGNV